MPTINTNCISVYLAWASWFILFNFNFPRKYVQQIALFPLNEQTRYHAVHLITVGNGMYHTEKA